MTDELRDKATEKTVNLVTSLIASNAPLVWADLESQVRDDAENNTLKLRITVELVRVNAATADVSAGIKWRPVGLTHADETEVVTVRFDETTEAGK